MEQRTRGMLRMALCAVMWSMGGIFIKLVPWHGMAIAGWRCLIGAAVVSTYLIIRRVKIRITPHAVLVGVAESATFCSFVMANKMTTAANAIVLQFTAPVFLLIFTALMTRKRPQRSDMLVVMATLAGISLFFFEGLALGNTAGNLVAIAGGVTMGLMYLAMGSAPDEDAMGGMLLGHLLTAAVGIPFSFVPGGVVLTSEAVTCLIILGVFQLGLPYILYVLATRTCPPLACSLIAALEPLLNPVWVMIFDGERPGVFALIGGVIVIGSVTVWTVWRGRHPEEGPANA